MALSDSPVAECGKKTTVTSRPVIHERLSIDPVLPCSGLSGDNNENEIHFQ
jgi:hypothetical protein